MSIRISQIKEHLISLDQARYANSIMDKYMDTATFMTSKKFYNTTFPSDMILTKNDVYASYEQVKLKFRI